MRPDLWGMLRDARYALPRQIERFVGGPGPEAAARICGRLHRSGLTATVGHFPANGDSPDDVAAVNRTMAACLRSRAGDVYLSVKAPPLGFDPDHLRALAEAAAAARLTLMFDAHAPHQAEPTQQLFAELLARYPGTGCVLPARWQRSPADAERFRDSSARLRIVKGEWADPEWSGEIEDSYLGLIARLAGRRSPVAVATHCPTLAERALALLLDAGTPCELEQLRGLPMHRTMAIARRWAVPVRVYVPFGRGWWPYALDKALARPYLLPWLIRDRLGWADSPRYRPA